MCIYNKNEVLPLGKKKVLSPKPKTVNPLQKPAGIVKKKLAVKTESNNNASTSRANGIKAFLAIMIHAINCGSNCNQVSCKKMKIVVQHYVAKCDKLDSGLPCKLCSQLERIVTTGHVCPKKWDPNSDCSVPMCDLILAKYRMRFKRVQQIQLEQQLVKQEPMEQVVANDNNSNSNNFTTIKSE